MYSRVGFLKSAEEQRQPAADAMAKKKMQPTDDVLCMYRYQHMNGLHERHRIYISIYIVYLCVANACTTDLSPERYCCVRKCDICLMHAVFNAGIF